VPEALVIVDYQNDFNPGGALGVPGGDEIAGEINALAASGDYALVVATRDWHPPDHGSFAEQGGPWPAHCVQGTPGAELSERLNREAIDAVIDTGTGPADEGYSGFENPELRELLRLEQIDAVTIVGLATDVCVKHTAADALRETLRVTIMRDGVRGIDGGDSSEALRALSESGALVV
jgi:nicotinamidase/pyrazinamidase